MRSHLTFLFLFFALLALFQSIDCLAAKEPNVKPKPNAVPKQVPEKPLSPKPKEPEPGSKEPDSQKQGPKKPEPEKPDSAQKSSNARELRTVTTDIGGTKITGLLSTITPIHEHTTIIVVIPETDRKKPHAITTEISGHKVVGTEALSVDKKGNVYTLILPEKSGEDPVTVPAKKTSEYSHKPVHSEIHPSKSAERTKPEKPSQTRHPKTSGHSNEPVHTNSHHPMSTKSTKAGKPSESHRYKSSEKSKPGGPSETHRPKSIGRTLPGHPSETHHSRSPKLTNSAQPSETRHIKSTERTKLGHPSETHHSSHGQQYSTAKTPSDKKTHQLLSSTRTKQEPPFETHRTSPQHRSSSKTTSGKRTHQVPSSTKTTEPVIPILSGHHSSQGQHRSTPKTLSGKKTQHLPSSTRIRHTSPSATNHSSQRQHQSTSKTSSAKKTHQLLSSTRTTEPIIPIHTGHQTSNTRKTKQTGRSSTTTKGESTKRNSSKSGGHITSKASPSKTIDSPAGKTSKGSPGTTKRDTRTAPQQKTTAPVGYLSTITPPPGSVSVSTTSFPGTSKNTIVTVTGSNHQPTGVPFLSHCWFCPPGGGGLLLWGIGPGPGIYPPPIPPPLPGFPPITIGPDNIPTPGPKNPDSPESDPPKSNPPKSNPSKTSPKTEHKSTQSHHETSHKSHEETGRKTSHETSQKTSHVTSHKFTSTKTTPHSTKVSHKSTTVSGKSTATSTPSDSCEADKSVKSTKVHKRQVAEGVVVPEVTLEPRDTNKSDLIKRIKPGEVTQEAADPLRWTLGRVGTSRQIADTSNNIITNRVTGPDNKHLKNKFITGLEGSIPATKGEDGKDVVTTINGMKYTTYNWKVRWDWEPKNNKNNKGDPKGVHVNFEIVDLSKRNPLQTFAVYNPSITSEKQFKQKLQELAEYAEWDMDTGKWKNGADKDDPTAKKKGVRQIAKRWAAIRGAGGPCDSR
ncbi:hypothetical protein MMC17_010121 [Xylographa soralifera]|nr:hypothetical protein [Xylographa soralifera]